MKRRKGWHQVQFSLDAHASACPGCGGTVHFLRRGRIRLLPRGHRAPDGGVCPQLAHQDGVLRTARRCHDAGVRQYTEAELVKALR